MTDVIVILDESGSMSSMGNEPLQALNHFVDEQKKVDPNSLFSLYLFSSTVRCPYLNVPLSSVPVITDYQPNTMTALFDSIDRAITEKMATERKTNVTVVIITDGMDNVSHVSGHTIKDRIAFQEKEHNWKFIYLAANQDAFSNAQRMSIPMDRASSFDQRASGGLVSALATTCGMVSAMRRAMSTPCPTSLDSSGVLDCSRAKTDFKSSDSP